MSQTISNIMQRVKGEIPELWNKLSGAPGIQYFGFMDSVTLIRSLVETLKATRGMTQGEIAQLLGISDSAISAYMRGYEPDSSRKAPRPNGDALLAAIQAVGGDIRRALPDYEPEDPGDLEIEGTVTANSGVFSSDDERRSISGGFVGYLRDSRLYSATTGKTAFIKVAGNSMSPSYPDGCLLVCRRPINGKDVPDNSPVIARVNGDMTFKLIQRIDKLVNLVPINVAEHKVGTYKATEVEVDWIVVGRFIPNEYAPVRSHRLSGGVSILRRPKGQKKKGKLPDVEV